MGDGCDDLPFFLFWKSNKLCCKIGPRYMNLFISLFSISLFFIYVRHLACLC